MRTEHVGVVGYGRFGRLWAAFLREHFTVWIHDADPVDAPEHLPLPELCARVEVLFLCVPIRRLEGLLAELRPLLRPGTVIFDTCSVKTQPAAWLGALADAAEGLTLVASHPMFGPDSAAASMEGLPIATWLLEGDREAYVAWQDFFAGNGLRVVELSPEEHDRLAAYSQGVTHYIGRVLNELALESTPIDTHGFALLLALIEQTCNDSWELFHDLQVLNPYTAEMRLSLEAALDRVYAALLPERVAPEALVIGIQGGEGSFNEEAALWYLEAHREDYRAWRLEYLFTSAKVLEALHRGEIDLGVFAVQNARGGVVMETIEALCAYNCRIIAPFELAINHGILYHPEAEFSAVDTLISHPQALAQCAGNLARGYPQLKLVSGEGDMIDQALCAKRLSEGVLPATTAVLAPPICAEKYGLAVQAEMLQDLGDRNLTTFFWVAR